MSFVFYWSGFYQTFNVFSSCCAVATSLENYCLKHGLKKEKQNSKLAQNSTLKEAFTGARFLFGMFWI